MSFIPVSVIVSESILTYVSPESLLPYNVIILSCVPVNVLQSTTNRILVIVSSSLKSSEVVDVIAVPDSRKDKSFRKYIAFVISFYKIIHNFNLCTLFCAEKSVCPFHNKLVQVRNVTLQIGICCIVSYHF